MANFKVSMGSCWADWSWKPRRSDELARRAGAIKEDKAMSNQRLGAILRGMSKSERDAVLASVGIKAKDQE